MRNRVAFVISRLAVGDFRTRQDAAGTLRLEAGATRKYLSLWLFMVGALAGAQQPTGLPKTREALTIVYRVDDTLVLPKANLQRRIARNLARMRAEWQASGKSPTEIENFADQYAKSQSLRHRAGQVQFSYDGAHLFYSFQPDSGSTEENLEGRVMLYWNGTTTFRLLGRGTTIWSGKHLDDLWYFPVLGTPVLHTPLIRAAANPALFEQLHIPATAERGDVLFQFQGGRSLYLPGVVERNGGDIERAWVGGKEHPLQIDRFSGERLGALRLAKRAEIDIYEEDPSTGLGSQTKERQIVYSTLSVDDRYCGASPKSISDLMRFNDAVLIRPAKGPERLMMFDRHSPSVMKLFEEPGAGSSFLPRMIFAGGIGALVCATTALIRGRLKGRP